MIGLHVSKPVNTLYNSMHSNLFTHLLGCLFVFSWAWPGLALPPEADGPRITPVVRAVDKALPSVVNISTEQLVRVTDPFAAYFDEFFQRPARYFRKYIPLGSGVFVDPSGLVLTNFHVVRRASNIEIRTLDGDSFPGRIIAFDMPNDLALIQVLTDRPGQTFPAIALAMPDDAILGETVVAVGNPFGLEIGRAHV